MKFGYQGAYHVDERQNARQQRQLSATGSTTACRTSSRCPPTLRNRARVRYTALYAQEQWTRGRLTLQGAVRYDHAWSYFPEQQVGPERFVPVPIVFPETTGVSLQRHHAADGRGLRPVRQRQDVASR